MMVAALSRVVQQNGFTDAEHTNQHLVDALHALQAAEDAFPYFAPSQLAPRHSLPFAVAPRSPLRSLPSPGPSPTKTVEGPV